MLRSFCAIAPALFVCGHVPTVAAPVFAGEVWEGPNASLQERFAFSWDAIEFSSKAVNPDTISDTGGTDWTRTLDISANLDILDANNLAALYVKVPEVIDVTDETGSQVQCVSQEPPSKRFYQRLISDYKWAGKRVREPKSWSLTISMELDPNQPFPSLLSVVRGYICAIYAEDVIEIDVPFVQTASTIIVRRIEVIDPNSGWIDVGHDLEIRVLTAQRECRSVYYETDVRATSGSIQGLNFSGESDFAVIETQLLDSGFVQRLLDFPDQITKTLTADTVACAGYVLPAPPDVGGIRHRIAVRPVEVRIPFEFTNIPLPSVEPASQR